MAGCYCVIWVLSGLGSLAAPVVPLDWMGCMNWMSKIWTLGHCGTDKLGEMGQNGRKLVIIRWASEF